MQKYDLGPELGRGTFGVVARATQRQTGKQVALKKFEALDTREGLAITAFREITILRKLHHVNVVQVLEVLHTDAFYTVCPYLSCDLNGLLRNPRVHLGREQVKCIMNQLLQGLAYVHAQGYLHRDIKTANVLLDHFGTVKLGDFGLARVYHGPKADSGSSYGGFGGNTIDYTGIVVTRWYRAPEILLGDRKYSTSVDLWGVGCILAEMILKRPLFEGKSDLHQAELVFQLVGTPDQQSYPDCHLINSNGVNLKTIYKRSLESRFRDDMLGEGWVELLDGLLKLDPTKRLNAQGALKSKWFELDPPMADKSSLMGIEESHEMDFQPGSQQQSLQQSQQLQSQQQPPRLPEKQLPHQKEQLNRHQVQKPPHRPWSRHHGGGQRKFDLTPKRDREDPYYTANKRPHNGHGASDANGKGSSSSSSGANGSTKNIGYGSAADQNQRLEMMRGLLHKRN